MSDKKRLNPNKVYKLRSKDKGNTYYEDNDNQNQYEESMEVDKNANDLDEGTIQTNNQNHNQSSTTTNKQFSKTKTHNKTKHFHGGTTTKLPDIHANTPINNRYKKNKSNCNADDLYQELYQTKTKMHTIHQELKDLRFSYGKLQEFNLVNKRIIEEALLE